MSYITRVSVTCCTPIAGHQLAQRLKTVAFYSIFIDAVEDVGSLLLCCPSDHRGADPGEGLRAALPSGCLPQPVAWRLPQHEEDREPPAPLCGAGRRQGQDPPPAAGTVSAAASPTL